MAKRIYRLDECHKCRGPKDIDAQIHCRACIAANQRAFYARHKERIQARKKARYEVCNPPMPRDPSDRRRRVRVEKTS